VSTYAAFDPWMFGDIVNIWSFIGRKR